MLVGAYAPGKFNHARFVKGGGARLNSTLVWDLAQCS